MKEIQLTRGLTALIDDEDFEQISKHLWHVGTHGYAIRTVKEHGKTRKVYMHRYIARALEGEEVDHADCNKLNNCRSNLRICQHTSNLANRKTNRNNKLGVKGVIFRANRFEAKFFHQRELVFSKRFKTLEEAKAAYDEQHKIHHGEFSRS